MFRQNQGRLHTSREDQGIRGSNTFAAVGWWGPHPLGPPQPNLESVEGAPLTAGCELMVR